MALVKLSVHHLVSVACSLDCCCCLLMEGFSCDLPAFSVTVGLLFLMRTWKPQSRSWFIFSSLDQGREPHLSWLCNYIIGLAKVFDWIQLKYFPFIMCTRSPEKLTPPSRTSHNQNLRKSPCCEAKHLDSCQWQVGTCPKPYALSRKARRFTAVSRIRAVSGSDGGSVPRNVHVTVN